MRGFTGDMCSTARCSLVYLIFSAAHRQREELVEQMLLLCAADVGHVACEDTIQSTTVSDGGETQCDTSC